MIVASRCFPLKSSRPDSIREFVAFIAAFTVARHPYVSTVDMLRTHALAKKPGKHPKGGTLNTINVRAPCLYSSCQSEILEARDLDYPG